MEIKKGIAVSPGISVAKSLIIDSEDYRIPHRMIAPSQRTEETQRVRNAFAAAAGELTQLEATQEQADRSKIKDIFAVHLRFLRDRELRKKITDLISAERVTAEYAVSTVLREIASHFTSVKDVYISERAADIYDIERRLLKQLLGRKREDVEHISEEVAIVARELSPTQTAGFNKKYVKGLATDAGGRTSHTAIVARSLGIPAVVALEDLTEIVRGGDTVIIDGNRGIVIVNPDHETTRQYEKYTQEFVELEHKLDTIREKPAETRDGTKITLLGSICLWGPRKPKTSVSAQLPTARAGSCPGMRRFAASGVSRSATTSRRWELSSNQPAGKALRRKPQAPTRTSMRSSEYRMRWVSGVWSPGSFLGCHEGIDALFYSTATSCPSLQ